MVRPIPKGSATTLGLLLAASACTVTTSPTYDAPPRPSGVPRAAQWAGGADGGAWIRCREVPKLRPVVFDCEIYLGGTLEAKGRYALHEAMDGATGGLVYNRQGNRPADQPLRPFSSWDGTFIGFEDHAVLAPHGWVHYPGSGKRVHYEDGKQTQPDE